MARPDAPVLVLTTAPLELDAAALARTLVAGQLVACVNILPPMQSVYRWQGAIESASEVQLVMKTTMGCVEELRERLTRLHPYQVPEFLVIEACGGSIEYLEWLRLETAQPPR
jgi:periplasmic divalent cation tolerance protein